MIQSVDLKRLVAVANPVKISDMPVVNASNPDIFTACDLAARRAHRERGALPSVQPQAVARGRHRWHPSVETCPYKVVVQEAIMQVYWAHALGRALQQSQSNPIPALAQKFDKFNRNFERRNKPSAQWGLLGRDAAQTGSYVAERANHCKSVKAPSVTNANDLQMGISEAVHFDPNVLGNATAEAFAKGRIVAPTALSDGAPKSEHLARAVGGRLHSNHMTIDRIRTLAMAPLPQGARLPIVLIRVDGAWARTSVTLGAQILAPCLGARRVYLTLEKISKLLTCTSPKDQHTANYNMYLGRNLSAGCALTLGYHVTGRSLINQPMSTDPCGDAEPAVQVSGVAPDTITGLKAAIGLALALRCATQNAAQMTHHADRIWGRSSGLSQTGANKTFNSGRNPTIKGWLTGMAKVHASALLPQAVSPGSANGSGGANGNGLRPKARIGDWTMKRVAPCRTIRAAKASDGILALGVIMTSTLLVDRPTFSFQLGIYGPQIQNLRPVGWTVSAKDKEPRTVCARRASTAPAADIDHKTDTGLCGCAQSQSSTRFPLDDPDSALSKHPYRACDIQPFNSIFKRPTQAGFQAYPYPASLDRPRWRPMCSFDIGAGTGTSIRIRKRRLDRTMAASAPYMAAYGPVLIAQFGP